MAEYLVLARKYRSTTFDEVVGQEPISTTLKNAIATGRIAQAFLFTGTRGVGKTSVARILAKALNCLSSPTPTPQPCGTCDACISIARGDDMDVIEIDGASNRGIDEIRDLRSNAVLHPARSRYKIYYIDEVHMLTKEAFNALLKTLEEPPPHVKFIFATTEAEKVPATILSRCQRFDFRNIPTNEIAGHLAAICRNEGIDIEEPAIFRVARAAAGSMRDGVSLLDQLISSSAGRTLTENDVTRVLGTPPDEQIMTLTAAIAAGRADQALEQLDVTLAAGFPLEGLVAALSEQFRNVMLALTCGTNSKLIELPETQRQGLAELSKRFTIPAAVHAVGVCEQLGRSIRNSSSPRVLAEAAVVRLAAADKFVDAASLVQRLEQLSSASPAQKKNHSLRVDSPSRPAPVSRPPAPPLAAAAQSPAQPPPSPQPAQPARNHPAPQPAVKWDADWLIANWPAVVQAVSDAAGAPLAGLVQPAKVQSVDGDLITLGYDNAYEAIRQRAMGQDDRLASVLSDIVGRPVKCRFIATGEGSAVKPVGGLSSEQRAQIANDPAVQAVLDLFGGQLTDIKYDVSKPAGESDPVPIAAETHALQPPAGDELEVEDDD